MFCYYPSLEVGRVHVFHSELYHILSHHTCLLKFWKISEGAVKFFSSQKNEYFLLSKALQQFV